MKTTLASLAASAIVLVLGAASAVAGSPSATLTYRGLDADKVGTVYNASPDGNPDGHFSLNVDPGAAGKTVTLIELDSTTGGVWDTVPQGSWAVLGVVRDGKRLNPKDENLKDTISGKVTYDLYAGDYGYFASAHTFVAKVSFSDGTTITSAQEGAGPGEGTTSPATTITTTTPTTSSNEPDTHKAVPDFWATLSASVITHNTLGLGHDLALTSGARNNQVLTVSVLERATGCLVEGVWVELRDPNGNPVPGTRFQTQAGTAYMGGLRLQEAGLYHLWIYAKDAGGNVVMQSYLPLQVKDRHGEAFDTLNGRPFTYNGGGDWTEGKRVIASAFQGTSAAGNPFAAFVTGFQNLLSGIANSVLGPKPKAAAAQAVKILKGPAAPEVKVATVQSKTALYPAFLVTTLAQQAARSGAAGASTTKVKLISQDGASVISEHGMGLISNDGGSLLGQDGNGIVASGAGNIVASGAGNLTHGTLRRGLEATGSAMGSCVGGYKTVGQGKVQIVDGSAVLAGADGKIVPGTLVIGGKNAMPINGPAN